NGAFHREALRRLDWLVVRDLQLIETAEFWRVAPEIERGEVRTEEIGTEVFFFPAAAHTEKDGSFTNTQRLLQWHHKAVERPGDCRSDLEFIRGWGVRVKALYRASLASRDLPIQRLAWDYPPENKSAADPRLPLAEAVIREVSGYSTADGRPLPGY